MDTPSNVLTNTLSMATEALAESSQRGRPRVHDRIAIGSAICDAISSGQLAKDVCAQYGIDRVQLWRWQQEDEDFHNMYARARINQAHAFAEQAMDIADGIDEPGQQRLEAIVQSIQGVGEDDKQHLLNSLAYAAVQRDRIRVDTRKWFAAKLAPRLYGEKQQVELSGKDGGPIVVQAWQFGDKRVQF